MKRRSLIKAFTLSASIAAMGMTWTIQAAETIDEINAKGGVNGKMLEPVVVDPASNWPWST